MPKSQDVTPFGFVHPNGDGVTVAFNQEVAIRFHGRAKPLRTSVAECNCPSVNSTLRLRLTQLECRNGRPRLAIIAPSMCPRRDRDGEAVRCPLHPAPRGRRALFRYPGERTAG